MHPAPMPFFIAGGTVPSDAPCYVTRQADNDLFQALHNAEFCFVLDTRQVGKSSLMARTAERLRANDVRVALLDLTALGKEGNPENWYYGLLELIGQELRCLRPLRAYWEANGGLPLTQRFMQAIEQVALEKEPPPLVLAVDEIDFVRSLPFDTDDFFAGIRECHNRRAHQPALKRPTFCLIGSATPNDLIQNVHITPFNVGRRVTITDFTEQEAQPLAYGLTAAGKDGNTLLAQILYWTNGHPYLTQRLCAAALAPEVSGPQAIDQLAKRLFLSRRASATEDVNLAFVRDRLLKSDLNKDRLFGLYQTIHEEKRAVADDPRDPYCNALRLSGIVAEREGYLFVRNRIYRELFTREWAQEQMPGIEAAQHRREVRRARWQVASIAGCIIAVMGGLAYNANQQYQRANDSAMKLQIALTDAKNARHHADLSAQKAKDEAAEAARQKIVADKQKAEADRQREQAEQRKKEADKLRQKALEFVDILGQKEKKAKQSAVAARQEADRAERFRYIANMNLIQREYEANNISNTLTLLEDTRNSPCRGFEWGYWNRLCHLDIRNRKVGRGSISPDGKRIVGSDGKIARVWDIATAKEILTLKGHTKSVEVAFSPDSKRIVTVSDDNTAKIWDAKTGKEILTIKGIPEAGEVAISPDSRQIVTGGWRTTSKVWNAQTGKEIFSLTNGVRAIAYSPDSKRIATGSEGTVKVWNADTGREVLSFEGHTVERQLYGKSPNMSSYTSSGYISSIAFSPDGKRLVTGSQDKTAKVWDAKTGKEILVLKGHTHSVTSVAFSPDGTRIVTGSGDKTAKVWDAITGSELVTLKGHTELVTAVAFSPDGRKVITDDNHGIVKVWNADTSGIVTFSKHTAYVRSVAFSPDGKRVVTGSEDETARVWDAQTGKEIFLLNDQPNVKVSACALQRHGCVIIEYLLVAYSPDGKQIVTGSATKATKIWDAQTGRELLTLRAQGVQSIAFSPDSKRIVTGNWDKTARVWDAQTGKELLTLRHSQIVASVAFSPDGRRIVTGGYKTLKEWDATTGKEMLVLKEHTDEVRSVAFSPDGKRIVTGSDDNTAKIWNATTGKEIRILRGHTSYVMSVAFSPDGKRIVTGSNDFTAKVWDATTGRELLVLNGHTDTVRSAAFSPDGKQIVTGSDDNTAKVWIGE